MSKIRFIIAIVACALLQTACGSRSQRTGQEKEKIVLFPRPLPQVPSSITKADEQAKYMLEHFWDKFDFNHKDIEKHKGAFEAYFANYFGLLTSLDAKDIKSYALYPLNNSLDSVLKLELQLYRKYLYEDDSPMNNEAVYEEVLTWILQTPRTTGLQKEEARLLLELISKNKVGTQATDFVYEQVDGTKHHLRNLLSPYSLLVLAKSDCATCEAFVEQLKDNEELEAELNKLKLQIVLIYLDDRKEKGMNWDSLPKSVILGFDPDEEILQKQLYDIKATPTFYLLKRGGEVLMKETSPDEVLEYLKTIKN